MELDLLPAVKLKPRTFNVLIAPLRVMTAALNENLDIQRYHVLYVTGNYSRVLSGLDRRFTNIQVQRAFTAFQLLTILEDCTHTVLLVEYDHTLFEEADGISDYVTMAFRDVSSRSTVLLYSPAVDSFLDDISGGADRVFYLEASETAPASVSSFSSHGRRAGPRRRSSDECQTTLRAF